MNLKQRIETYNLTDGLTYLKLLAKNRSIILKREALQTEYNNLNLTEDFNTWSASLTEEAREAIENTPLIVKLNNIGLIHVTAIKTINNVTSIDTVAQLSDSILIKQSKEFYNNELNNTFDKTILKITTAYPEHEQKTWDKQEIEARAYIADNTTATPILTNISTIRGIDVATLAAKVIEKADAYQTLISTAIGYRQKAEDMLDLVSTVTDLESVLGDIDSTIKTIKGLI